MENSGTIPTGHKLQHTPVNKPQQVNEVKSNLDETKKILEFEEKVDNKAVTKQTAKNLHLLGIEFNLHGPLPTARRTNKKEKRDQNATRRSKSETDLRKIENKEIKMEEKLAARDSIKMVPEYNGKNIPIDIYLDCLDNAIESTKENQETLLFRLVKAKLSGEAQRLTVPYDLNSIEELKDRLKSIFSNVKSREQLNVEVGSIVQKKDESIHNYAHRILELGRKMLTAYKEEAERNATEITAVKKDINASLMRYFKKGLKEEMEVRLASTYTKLDEMTKDAERIERELKDKNTTQGRKIGRSVFTYKKSKDPREENYDLEFESEEERETRRINRTDSRAMRRNYSPECSIFYDRGHQPLECPFNPVGEILRKKNQKCVLCDEVGHCGKDAHIIH